MDGVFMKCGVWKSPSKEFTYVYLAEDCVFDDLPIALRNAFGEPEWVMDLELTTDRRLAYEDIEQVRQNLAGQGYHLQMPPTDDPTGLLELTEKKETLL
jgi:uncharacterized protein YcgL (UPF0745 family)